MAELFPVVFADRDLKVDGWLVVSQGAIRAIAGPFHDDVVLLAVGDRRLLRDGKPPRFSDLAEATEFIDSRLSGEAPDAPQRPGRQFGFVG